LLEEQLGHSTNALEYYEQSFRHAPELGDPQHNPAVLNSRLVLGARLRDYDERRFEAALPMSYLQPAQVRRVRRQFEQTPLPNPAPTPGPGAAGIGAEPETSSGVASTKASVPEPTAMPKPQKPQQSIPARRVPPVAPTPTGSDQPIRSTDPPTGTSVVPIGNTSDEVHLMPWWPRLSQTVLALV
jgi:hypothetical protein